MKKVEDVCKSLYDKVERNGMLYDFSMPFSKSFFVHQYIDSEVMDVMMYADVENMDFLTICYAKLLKRLPETEAINAWKKLADLPKEEFQKRILTSIGNSAERKIKKTVMKNFKA